MAMLHAYILIQTNAPETRSVSEVLRAFPEVRSAALVTGEYDIIASVECPTNEDGVMELLHDRIRQVPGVSKTVTCIVLTGRQTSL